MIRLLSFLVSGCWHRWAIIREGPLVIRNSDTGDVLTQSRYFTLQCQRCGAIKQKDLT